MPARTLFLGPVGDDGLTVRAISVSPGPDLVGQLRGEVVDVAAVIAILRDVLAQPPRDDRAAQVADLQAGVVEVVLARDSMAGTFEHAAEQVSHERAARIAHVQRAGGVGGDEFHVEVAGIVLVHATEVVAGHPCLVEQAFEPGGREAHVDEPRRRHRDLAQRVRRRRRTQGLRDGLGDLQRRASHRPGQLHGQVRGQVSMVGIPRTFDLERGSGLILQSWKGTGFGGRGPGLIDDVVDACTDGADRGHASLPMVTTISGSASSTRPGKTSLAAAKAACGSYDSRTCVSSKCAAPPRRATSAASSAVR